MNAVSLSTLALSGIAANLDQMVDEIQTAGSGRRVFVALATRDFRKYAVSGFPEWRANAPEAPLPLGCCAKLLLAALTQRAIAEGYLDSASPLHKVVGSSLKTAFRPFLDITVGQLLNHTHGLPKSGNAAPTFRTSGEINAEALARRISSNPRIAEPGEIYSYGHEGAWICAALLEEIWGSSFFSLLGSKLLASSSLSRSEDSIGVCPAGSGGLALHASAFSEFLLDHAIGHIDSNHIVPMPGWAASTTGCSGGWHAYEDSWIGHDSVLPNYPMLARVDRRRHVAIVVMSHAVHPIAVAHRIFSSVLPDLVKLRVPRMLPRDAGSGGDMRAYCGSYANGSIRVEVVTAGSGIRLMFPGESNPSRGALIQAEHGVYLNPGAAAKLGAIVQFLTPSDGKYKFLWTGQYVLARVQPAIN